MTLHISVQLTASQHIAAAAWNNSAQTDRSQRRDGRT